MRNRATSPAQLAGLSLLGTFAFVAALTTSLFAAHYRHGNARADFIGCAVLTGFLFAIGGFLMAWSQRAIRQGILLERWTDAEIKPVRHILRSRPLSLTILCILGAAFIAMLMHSFTQPGTGISSVIFYSCLLLHLQITSLKRSFLPAPDIATRLDLQSSAPVESEHWGELQR